MKTEPTIKQLDEMKKKMRKVAAFTKYCADCGETFGSDDINKFLTMLQEHKCKKVGE